MRRSARTRFDEPLVAPGTNARAESGACHSFGRASSLDGCDDVTGTLPAPPGRRRRENLHQTIINVGMLFHLMTGRQVGTRGVMIGRR